MSGPLSSSAKPAHVSLYCDFDGTIAQSDMIGEIMKRFVPELGRPIVDAVNAGQLTVKDGVEALFGLIPSRKFPDVRDYAMSRTILRPGFSEFVAACADLGWPLTVVSGGFDFFVHPALAPFGDGIRVFCNGIDHSGEYLRVVWSVLCDDTCEGGCGLCKPTVMRNTVQTGSKVVVIGDGVTDVKAARQADFVFARDKLLAACQRQGIPFAPFDTFFDITAHPLFA